VSEDQVQETIVTEGVTPLAKTPKCSIIIPVSGQLQYTTLCFERLLRHTRDVEYVFVDDGSDDGTPGYLKDIATHHEGVVKVVTLPGHRGFPVAINCGLMAIDPKSPYVALCNNDVLVTEGWLEGLIGALEGAEQQTGMSGFAIVGPMTNWAWPQQMVDQSGQPSYRLDLPPQAAYLNSDIVTLDSFAKEHKRKFAGQRSSTKGCSGFLVVIKRDVFDELGGLSEELTPGGFDDNDLGLRARYKGYRSLIAHDVYVHHFGSRTLNKLYPEATLGLANRWKFYDMWLAETLNLEHKLVIGYRVKDPDPLVFQQSLEKSLTVADHVVVFDDNSDLNFRRELRQVCNENPKVTLCESQWQTFNERRDRQFLWDQCAAVPGVTWVLVLDGDEILEEQFDRHFAEKLMRNPNPEVLAYNVHIFNMWNTPDYVREDGRWGTHRLTAMAKVLPNMVYGRRAGNRDGLHCGRLPHIPATNTSDSSVRIKHYGYMTPAQRAQKFKWYSKHDRDFRPDILQAPSYDYIVDELECRVRVWSPKQKISCFIMCGNEKDWFPDTFDSVYQCVHQMVVVDTGSTDGSLDCLKYFPFDVKVISEPWKDDYSYMRNVGKNACDGEWILQLDADERLPQGFGQSLIRLCDIPIHGWQFNIRNYQVGGNFTLSQTVRLFRNLPTLFYTGLVHETLDDSMRMMSAKVLTSPFELSHFGYQKGHYDVQKKLDYYETLNKKMIEDHPNDGRGYFNLGLHYINDGKVDEGVEMLEKCLELAPNHPNALKEMGAHHLRWAMAYHMKLQHVLPPAHHLQQFLKEVLNRLSGVVPQMTIVGKAAMTEEQWQEEVQKRKVEESKSKVLTLSSKPSKN